MIPLMHDLKGKKVVIFGGGDVGLRKAEFFLAECSVTVISMDFCGGFTDRGITLIKADLSNLTDGQILEYLSDCTVCVAATSDTALNNRIHAICMKKGLMFDNAAGESGNIIVPSVIRGRNYSIAISTGGRSPATARYMRRYFEKNAPQFDEMIELQCELRELLKSCTQSQSERKRIITATLEDENVWKELKNGKNTAMEYIRKVYL